MSESKKLEDVRNMTTDFIKTIENFDDDVHNIVVTLIKTDNGFMVSMNGTKIDPELTPIAMIIDVVNALADPDPVMVASSLSNSIIRFMESHKASPEHIAKFFEQISSVYQEAVKEGEKPKLKIVPDNGDIPFKPTVH